MSVHVKEPGLLKLAKANTEAALAMIGRGDYQGAADLLREALRRLEAAR